MNGKKDRKRTVYYVSTDMWQETLDSYSKLVFAYLSYCSNIDGESFPSIFRIAKSCRVSRSTVKRSLEALRAKGLIVSKPRRTSQNGKTTNLYRLNVGVFEGGKPKKAKLKETTEAEAWTKDTELEELLERLNAGNYYDADFSAAAEDAIRYMWTAPSMRFDGREIPQAEVRQRLRELDIYCLDDLYDELGKRDLEHPSAYIKACLYHAPVEQRARTAMHKRSAAKLTEWARK